MSLAPKNSDWQPSASIAHLHARARIIQQLRDFFAVRNVLEVETPLLCSTSVTDPFIDSIPALYQSHPEHTSQTYYLQTSCEYAMKRLLAAGSGDIFQLSKVFRQGEVGPCHNPEFTMLEWYRIHFDHHALMDEVDTLLQTILNTLPATRYTYQAVFQEYLQIDPHTATLSTLQTCAQQAGIHFTSEITHRDTWLDLLFTHYLEPRIGQDKPCFVYDYPSTQAALARIQPSTPPVAARFEVYYRGIELANGFHELQNAKEQRERFLKNMTQRQTLGLPTMALDEKFLSALDHGLPDCAGVALGVDRLVMLALACTTIGQIISFKFDQI